MEKLKRTIQCKTCPWKKDADPYEIPNGYSCKLHEGLSSTIADPNEIRLNGPLNIMACHYSEVGEETPCVGWLHNQLGAGNNILLRIQAMSCENIRDIQVIEDQHETFEDTLPSK